MTSSSKVRKMREPRRDPSRSKDAKVATLARREARKAKAAAR